MSALALYLLMYDNEPGNQVFTVACDKEQASIIYKESCNMIEASPLLARALKVRRSKYLIEHPTSKSTMRVFSSEKSGKHGYNAHACL
jgi:phage terminase large subunit-like protein